LELTQAKTDEMNQKNNLQKKYDSAVYFLEIEKTRNKRLTDANTSLQFIANDREMEIENLKVNGFVDSTLYSLLLCSLLLL
jgi:hypothetical protein